MHIVRVVHLGQLTILQWRYIVPSVILIESWTWYWSYLSDGTKGKEIFFGTNRVGIETHESGAAAVACVLFDASVMVLGNVLR